VRSLIEVLVLHVPGVLGEDRERVGVPLDQHLAGFDGLAVGDLEARAVDHRVALAVAPLGVLHHQRSGPVHDDDRPLGVDAAALGGHDLEALVADRAGVLRVERGLLRDPRRRAADVEGPHRELRAGLADRLRGDDADGHAELPPA
jgi:hypothetical protein